MRDLIGAVIKEGFSEIGDIDIDSLNFDDIRECAKDAIFDYLISKSRICEKCDERIMPGQHDGINCKRKPRHHSGAPGKQDDTLLERFGLI